MGTVHSEQRWITHIFNNTQIMLKNTLCYLEVCSGWQLLGKYYTSSPEMRLHLLFFNSWPMRHVTNLIRNKINLIQHLGNWIYTYLIGSRLNSYLLTVGCRAHRGGARGGGLLWAARGQGGGGAGRQQLFPAALGVCQHRHRLRLRRLGRIRWVVRILILGSSGLRERVLPATFPVLKVVSSFLCEMTKGWNLYINININLQKIEEKIRVNLTFVNNRCSKFCFEHLVPQGYLKLSHKLRPSNQLYEPMPFYIYI